jgi:hypothetical protein
MQRRSVKVSTALFALRIASDALRKARLQPAAFLLYFLILGEQVMAIERLMLAVGRMERALSRLETGQRAMRPTNDGLMQKHEQLKQETRAAIAEIDTLLASAS